MFDHCIDDISQTSAGHDILLHRRYPSLKSPSYEIYAVSNKLYICYPLGVLSSPDESVIEEIFSSQRVRARAHQGNWQPQFSRNVFS
jgi:hypothetical protein